MIVMVVKICLIAIVVSFPIKYYYHKKLQDRATTIYSETQKAYAQISVLKNENLDLRSKIQQLKGNHNQADEFYQYISSLTQQEAARLPQLQRELSSTLQKNQMLLQENQRLQREQDALQIKIQQLTRRLAETIPLTPEEQAQEQEYKRFAPYLDRTEFTFLAPVQKYQLALDRYQERTKTNWEIGIAYERYVGYLYEMNQYAVEYTGATQRRSDKGRDLIASKSNKIIIVQCKNWAKGKEIHEKHIMHLYGSVSLYESHNPDKKVSGVLITTTVLSDEARKCAKRLKIEVRENLHFKPHPLIKCICSPSGKRFYLPFDPEYDTIIFDAARGDIYVETVAQAVSADFERPQVLFR